MRLRFRYLRQGQENFGTLVFDDSLLGPLSIYVNGSERCYSCLASHSQTEGTTALFVDQRIDTAIRFRPAQTVEHPGMLLGEFLDWIAADTEGSDIGEVLRQLLSEHLG